MYIFNNYYFYKCMRHNRCRGALESVIGLQRICSKAAFFAIFCNVCPLGQKAKGVFINKKNKIQIFSVSPLFLVKKK